MSSSCEKKLCNHSTIAPYVKIVGTTDVEIKLNSKELSFFVFKKVCETIFTLRQVYNVGYYEATYHYKDKVMFFNDSEVKRKEEKRFKGFNLFN